VGLAVAVALVTVGLLAPGTGSAASDQWDARVAPIAAAVARYRGLEFDHPVPVEFVADKKFRKYFDAPGDRPSKKDAARLLGELRAVGLVVGDVDLAQAVSAEQQSSVLAFYDPAKRKVFIRGGKQLGPAARVTLAHELTHVLQDQHFDLDRLERRADNDPNGSSDALRALVEGDADRIEDRYRAHLSRQDRAEADRELDAGADAGGAGDGTEGVDVPFVLQLVLGAPYAFGDSLVSVIAADGGNAAVNRAFHAPAFTQEVFVDPASALDRPPARHVQDPKAARGERAVGSVDSLGALDLYLMLAAHTDPLAAFDAAQDWGAGRVRTVKQAERSCVRITLTGRNRAATDRLGSALDTWAAAYPQGSPVVGHGRTLTVVSCDPGAAAGGTPPDEALRVANNLVLFHNDFEAEIISEGVDPPAAQCMASGVVRFPDVRALFALPDEQITAEQVPSTVGAHVQPLLSRCVRGA